MKRKRIRRCVGAVVEIPLSDGYRAYGQVLKEPLIAFFDARTKERLSIDEILVLPVAFSILVMNYAITDGDWEVIGHAPVSDEINQRPPFFKKDGISGKLSITFDGSEEIPATLEEVQGLECAAVWNPEHMAERLEDHFAGRPNIWVERFKPT